MFIITKYKLNLFVFAECFFTARRQMALKGSLIGFLWRWWMKVNQMIVSTYMQTQFHFCRQMATKIHICKLYDCSDCRSYMINT